MKPRVVLDCVIFLQGAGQPASPARACFELLERGVAVLYVSAEVLAEVEEVFNRPKVKKKFPLLTAEAIQAFLQRVESLAMSLASVPQVFTYLRDPKDEKYVNLALAAGASYLVTRDHDLLDLMDPTIPAGSDFRQRFPDLTILNPVAFLRAMTPTESEDGTSSGR